MKIMNNNIIITKVAAAQMTKEARERNRQQSLELINNLIGEAATEGKDFLKVRIELIDKHVREALITAGYEVIVNKGGRDEALDRWAPPCVIVYWGEKPLIEYEDDNIIWDGSVDENNSSEIPDIDTPPEQDEDIV